MGKRKIHTDKHFIELSLVHSISAVQPDNTEKLKKQIHARKWFSRDAIVSVEEYVTSKNTIAKSRSIVFDKYSGRFYATYHSPQEVLQSLGNSNEIGFHKKNH